MGSWFGNLGLAYKYCLVFGSLLLGTLVLGCIKLLFDRKKLKEHIRKQDEERANKKDDTVELNTRERDEGDLFGVRAIEAGYFGGVYQSRPTSEVNTPSRAMSPSASQNTLVAEQLSQKLREIPSSASSVRSLAINEHSRSASRDVESTTQRRQLPHLVLRPSEAELSGRINHNGSAVNMTLDVPPSPILAQHQQQNAHHSGHLSHNSPTKGNFEDLRRADGYDSTGRTKSEQRMAQVAHSREGSNLTWDDQHSSVGTSPRGGNLRNSPESTDYPSFPNGSRSPPRVHSRSLTPTGNQASDRQPGYLSHRTPSDTTPPIQEPPRIHSSNPSASSHGYSPHYRVSSPIDPHGLNLAQDRLRPNDRGISVSSSYLDQPPRDSFRSSFSFSFSDADAEYELANPSRENLSTNPPPRSYIASTPASTSGYGSTLPKIPLPAGLAEPLDLERPGTGHGHTRGSSSQSLQKQRFSRYFASNIETAQRNSIQQPAALNISKPQSAVLVDVPPSPSSRKGSLPGTAV